VKVSRPTYVMRRRGVLLILAVSTLVACTSAQQVTQDTEIDVERTTQGTERLESADVTKLSETKQTGKEVAEENEVPSTSPETGSTSVSAEESSPSTSTGELASSTVAPTTSRPPGSAGTTSVPATTPSRTPAPTSTTIRPNTTSTTAVPSSSVPSSPSTPDAGADSSLDETIQVLDDFEGYATGDRVPPTWFNYGMAGGGVSVVGVSDQRARAGQSGSNQMLAWGYDASRAPGYGGVGKEYGSPQNWTQYSGIKFWFYGSGEGGRLQVEIGEDKTTDVERYRAPAFTDNQAGWRVVRVPFDSFTPASWNPTPGNEVLDLVSVENVVIAVNSGATIAGVAIDDVSLYRVGSSSTTTTTIPQQGNWPPTQLVWSDEFNRSGIDSSNWRYDIGGWGWGNGEAQYYTSRPENARVEDGALIIEALREDYQGSAYTSARLLSQNLREFQYGRIEARVKVPSGSGTWPAFWMLGTGLGQPGRTWPNVGEIDILEYVGREPNTVIGALHGPGYSGGNAIDQWSYRASPIADDWHVVAVEWNYEGIKWFLDGSQFHSVLRTEVPGEWVFDQPFFIILNLAIGGTLGGAIDPALQFPLRYYVDYVRVYQ
jgi:beta-glucanase (GH16 family)